MARHRSGEWGRTLPLERGIRETGYGIPKGYRRRRSGNTISRLRAAYLFPPLPSSCIHGADLLKKEPADIFLLSSPHARGKQLAAETREHGLPFIPSYTGQTRAWHFVPWPGAFHPRMHGANLAMSDIDTSPILSSPCTRGRQFCAASWSICLPFIPAYTGQTPRRRPKVVK